MCPDLTRRVLPSDPLSRASQPLLPLSAVPYNFLTNREVVVAAHPSTPETINTSCALSIPPAPFSSNFMSIGAPNASLTTAFPHRPSLSQSSFPFAHQVAEQAIPTTDSIETLPHSWSTSMFHGDSGSHKRQSPMKATSQRHPTPSRSSLLMETVGSQAPKLHGSSMSQQEIHAQLFNQSDDHYTALCRQATDVTLNSNYRPVISGILTGPRSSVRDKQISAECSIDRIAIPFLTGEQRLVGPHCNTGQSSGREGGYVPWRTLPNSSLRSSQSIWPDAAIYPLVSKATAASSTPAISSAVATSSRSNTPNRRMDGSEKADKPAMPINHSALSAQQSVHPLATHQVNCHVHGTLNTRDSGEKKPHRRKPTTSLSLSPNHGTGGSIRSPTLLTGSPPPCPIHSPQPTPNSGAQPPRQFHHEDERPSSPTSAPTPILYSHGLPVDSAPMLVKLLENVNADRAALNNEVIDLKASLLTKTEELERIRATLQQSTEQLTKQSMEMDQLKDVLQEKEQCLDQHIEGMKTLCHALQAAQQQEGAWAEQVAELQNEVTILQQAIRQAQITISEKEAEVQKMRRSYERCTAEQQVLIQRNRELQQKQEVEWQAVHSQHTIELERLKELIKEKELIVHQQSQALQDLQSSLQQSNATILHLEGESRGHVDDLEQQLKEFKELNASLQCQQTSQTAELSQDIKHKTLLLRNRTIELEALKQSHADVVQRNLTLENLVAELQRDHAVHQQEDVSTSEELKAQLLTLKESLEKKETELREAQYWIDMERAEKTAMRGQFSDRLAERDVELRRLQERCADLQLMVGPTEEVLRRRQAKDQGHLTEVAECLSELTRVRQVIDSIICQQPNIKLLLGNNDDDDDDAPLPSSITVGLAALKHDLYLLRGTLAKECAGIVAHDCCITQ